MITKATFKSCEKAFKTCKNIYTIIVYPSLMYPSELIFSGDYFCGDLVVLFPDNSSTSLLT